MIMNKMLLRSASLILAIVLALGVVVPGQATSQNATLMSNQTVNLAYFYKPPINGTAATVASNFGTVFLTGGDEIFVNSLIANGLTNQISQYFRSEAIQNPGTCTADPTNNQIANRPGDFCWISQNHPEWFLLDTNGNRMRTSPTSNYYRMDYGHPGWQQWFVTRLIETQQGKNWSGLFLDNLEASLAEIQNDGLASAKYTTDASYQAAVRSFLIYLQNNYSAPYGRAVVANVIAKREDAVWYDYLQYMSGGMKESWAVGWDSPNYNSESKWLSDLAVAENTQSQGRHIILVSQGDKADTTRQSFAFASYLLITNGKAAFRYANEDIYNEVWLYDNYRVNLGTPRGARYHSTGSTWRRDFTNGYVTVDPISHASTIATTTAATFTATPISTSTRVITHTPSSVPTLAVTSTPTTRPTLAVTNTASSAPTTVPTLAVTNTPSSIPTLAVPSTATTIPTLVATNTALVLPTWTSAPTNLPAASATPGSSTTTTMYNESNSAFSYSGRWSTVTDSRAYGGAFKLTQRVGASATLQFTGQSFTIIYKTGPLFGKMDVYVDGVLVGTIDQYAATAAFQQRWSYTGPLTAATHTLKLVYASPAHARVTVDAVSIP